MSAEVVTNEDGVAYGSAPATAHHQMGMSKWPAWLTCCRYEPSDKETDDSEAGTLAHGLLAALLEDRPGPPCDDLHLIHVAEWAAGELRKYGDWWLCERRVEFRHVPADEGGRLLNGLYGTADAILTPRGAGRLIVADLKAYSRGEHEYWPQLMGYAAAFLDGDPHAPFVDDLIELVVLHGGSRKVEVKLVTREECLAVARDVVGRRAAEKSPPRVCVWCKYCAALARCPAVGLEVFGARSDPGQTEDMTADELADALFHVPAVEAWCKAVKDRAMELAAENGGVLPASYDGVSWRVSEREGNRIVRDAREAFSLCSQWVGADAFMGITKVGVGDLEKLLRSANVDAAAREEALAVLCSRGAPSRSLLRFRV